MDPVTDEDQPDRGDEAGTVPVRAIADVETLKAMADPTRLGPGLTDAEETSADTEATVAAGFELYRKQLFAARRAQLRGGMTASGQPHRGALINMSVATLLIGYFTSDVPGD
jgi:hypothetical protein